MTDHSSGKVSLRQRIKGLLARLLALESQEATGLADRVRRLGQLYATLSKVNQAVVQLRDRQP